MAGTTSDKLTAVLISKESIRSAIEAKGVECGDDIPFSQYSEKILSITSGGSGSLVHGKVGLSGAPIFGVVFDIAGVGQYVKETIQ